MSRRDTIIIAVLLNSALLVVLFLTAVRSETDVIAQAPQLKPKELVQDKSVRNDTQADAIDKVLDKYADVLQEKKEQKKQPVTQKKVVTATAPEKKVLPHEEPMKTITIAKGDMLEKIARTHGVSVNAIIKANKLKSTRLRIGQKLLIPRKEISKAQPKKRDTQRYYVVKGGDNLWTIARKNKIQVETLLKLNNLDESKAKRLRPGDRLRIE